MNKDKRIKNLEKEIFKDNFREEYINELVESVRENIDEDEEINDFVVEELLMPEFDSILYNVIEKLRQEKRL